MRLVAYYPEGRRAKKVSMGVVLGDKVAPLTSISEFYDDVDMWTQHAAHQATGSLDLQTLELAPPVRPDAKIVCAAINYIAHGNESKLPTPEFPNLFARWAATLVVDGDAVPVPLAEPDGLDWEVELAAIVGKTLVDVDAETAEQGMLGYTVANDISARGSQVLMTTLSTGQWCLGKNPDRSCPISSFVESADSYDYRNQTLETRLNDKVMQSGNTNEMVFNVGELAAFASKHVTLRPGDLLLTGTPEGVGFARNPKILMRPGDTITVSVSGIGTISNPVVDSSGRD